MKVDYRVYWLQKRGGTPEEYEDSFCPKVNQIRTGSVFRCAVADGATETSFSGAWADLLVDGYVADMWAVSSLQQMWKSGVSGKNLPWYAEQKLDDGAFAAFLGITFLPVEGKDGDTRLVWRSKALGDCNLFCITGRTMNYATPITNWRAFGSSPVLLSTREDRNAAAWRRLVQDKGELRSGDMFYLMTDALGCWFMKTLDRGWDSIGALESISCQDSFAEFVNEQRSIKEKDGIPLMANDDVTFLRVVVSLL